MSVKVSIIMNCLNGEEFLKEAIDSIYAQSFTNWEIIFWDNCSTDESSTIAKSYDDKIKYFKASEQTSLGEARNLAISNATGEYISFLDTDDLWHKTKLAEQVKIMDANQDLVMCYAGIDEIAPSGKLIRKIYPKYKSGYIFKDLLMQFDINMVTPLIRLSALKKYNLNFSKDMQASEEYNLFMRLAAKGKIGTIQKVLGQWRIRGNSLTSRTCHRWATERDLTLDTILEDDSSLLEKFRSEFDEARARANYYRARYHMAIGEKKLARASLKKSINVNYKYLILYLILFLPSIVWKLLHSQSVKNKILPKILNITRSKPLYN